MAVGRAVASLAAVAGADSSADSATSISRAGVARRANLVGANKAGRVAAAIARRVLLVVAIAGAIPVLVVLAISSGGNVL